MKIEKKGKAAPAIPAVAWAMVVIMLGSSAALVPDLSITWTMATPAKRAMAAPAICLKDVAPRGLDLGRAHPVQGVGDEGDEDERDRARQVGPLEVVVEAVDAEDVRRRGSSGRR